MSRFRIAYKFILHFLSAKNTRGYGVHSPSVYHFTKFVVYNKSSYYVFSSIEKIRKVLKTDKRVLNVIDLGTGNDRKKTIAHIASTSIKSAKYGQLLYRLSIDSRVRNVLELGTSLGVTTAYLASSSSDIRCVTMEGCPQTAGIARENFNRLGVKNIQIEVGNIDQRLAEVLDGFEQLDLIFIDANHTLQAVLSYFEQCLAKVHTGTILVVDDIYWSAEMEQAWGKIKEHPRVTSTIDLFQLGIVFFNRNLHKKHYKMRY
ncbi:MAG: class I SAM-dependent methyltransferase [Bacteroidota bacterium]|nr:class I SAM-dependent methyltransferase [Bacteroidota bacterium]